MLFMIYTAFHVYRNADATEPIENVAEIRRIEKQFSKDSASIMANWKSDTTRLGDSVNLVVSKREIAISEEIRNIRSKTFDGETEIIKALAKSDKEFYEMQLAHIRSDIAKQETLINNYMDNLE